MTVDSDHSKCEIPIYFGQDEIAADSHLAGDFGGDTAVQVVKMK